MLKTFPLLLSNLPSRPFSVVVGSGPAAVACAQALVEQNQTVVMLDAGRQLEPERQSKVESLRSRPATAWSEAELHDFSSPVKARMSGVVQKLLFGSDFVYGDQAEGKAQMQRSGTKAQFSFAQGGFSKVWGATVLPYRDADLAGWPIQQADLAPHYRAVLGMMPLTGSEGNLHEHFPPYGAKSLKPLVLAAQAAALLTLYANNKKTFARRGIWMDRAQLAVDSQACTYCRLCMYGCPYDLIYSTTHSLRQLQAHEKFHYHPGWRVDSISEGEGTVRLHVQSLQGHEALELACDRVYLGAGAISSSRIMLESMAAFNRPLAMLDSQMFLAPMFSLNTTRNATAEATATLTQLCLELVEPQEQERTVHFQLYAYSDLLKKAFENFIPKKVLESRWFKEQFFGRLMIAQGFLDSSLSGKIELELRRDASGHSIFSATGRPNPLSRSRANRALRKLFLAFVPHGVMPLPFPAQFGEPGQSYHFGGTFPMRLQPGEFEADLLGRPTGYKRTHLIDAAIFPSIPATTITLSIMANAHRIGAMASRTLQT